ncbi:MAG: hypothetical protein G01um10148_800 [Parcubacteria group bacterium Gr01-1014_8]|nr:MAG: hypothetical protein G01um10148_800 [Parcubacteria group bacterium Gr01-1014_8]
MGRKESSLDKGAGLDSKKLSQMLVAIAAGDVPAIKSMQIPNMVDTFFGYVRNLEDSHAKYQDLKTSQNPKAVKLGEHFNQYVNAWLDSGDWQTPFVKFLIESDFPPGEISRGLGMRSWKDLEKLNAALENNKQFRVFNEIKSPKDLEGATDETDET